MIVMMTKIINFILRLFMPSLRQITNEINFGGGLHTKTVATNIDDNESPDMQNVVSDVYGSCRKRKGITKFNAQVLWGGVAGKGIYRAYESDGDRHLLAESGGSLYSLSSAGVATSKGTGFTGRLKFQTMNDLVVVVDDGLSKATQKYTMSSATLADLTGAPKAKYVKLHKSYLFFGNVNYNPGGGAANYPSRIVWSNSWTPEVYTATDWERVAESDGDVITGFSSFNDTLYIYKTRSIHAFVGQVFSSVNGDQILRPVADTGCIAPKTLTTVNNFDVFLASDGIRTYDGASSRIISDKIADIIERIPAARVADCAGAYDSVNKWYWFAYNDPTKLPASINNSVLIYDFVLGTWAPFKGINANMFSIWSGAGDRNEVYYISSEEGYVYQANATRTLDDAPLEKSTTTFESGETWSATGTGAADAVNFKDGVSGYKLTATATNTSYARRSTTQDLTNFNDGQDSSTSDYIKFWIYIDTAANVASIQLTFDIAEGVFDADTFSYTKSSGFANGWTQLSILKSDFTRAGALATRGWHNIFAIEIKATANSSGTINVTFDDIRLVKATNTPIDAYRETKTFDFAASALIKRFKDLYAYINHSTDFDLDIFSYTDNKTKTKQILDYTAKNQYLFIADSTNNRVVQWDKRTLTFVNKYGTSGTGNDNLSIPDNICGDDTHIWVADSGNARIVKRLKSDLSYVSQFGSAGTGNDNLSAASYNCVDDTYIYIMDNGNSRLMKRLKSDFTFVSKIGTAGSGNDNFNSPGLIAQDDLYLYIVDAGNNRIVKRLKSDLSYVSEIGALGNGEDQFNAPAGIAIDQKHIFITDQSNNRLKKLNKDDLTFVNKYGTTGTGNDNLSSPHGVAVDDTYVYIGDLGNDRIIKRLKSDLSYVSQFGSAGSGNNNLQEPLGFNATDIDYFKSSLKTINNNIWLEGKNISFKFSNKTIDNGLELHKMSISYMPKTLR